ncbi:hypothetical protein HKX48_008747 [Thoreauomyces humboldtii]|nr:hypothetical protein HKX48_008747 [Thoreauomyces humboldtii]
MVTAIPLLTLLLGRVLLASADALTFYSQPCNFTSSLEVLTPSYSFEVPGFGNAATDNLMDLQPLTGIKQWGIFAQGVPAIGLYICPAGATINSTGYPGGTLILPETCVPSQGEWTCKAGTCCQISGLRYSLQSWGEGSGDVGAENFNVSIPLPTVWPPLLGDASGATPVTRTYLPFPTDSPTSAPPSPWSSLPWTPRSTTGLPAAPTSPSSVKSGAGILERFGHFMVFTVSVTAGITL